VALAARRAGIVFVPGRGLARRRLVLVFLLIRFLMAGRCLVARLAILFLLVFILRFSTLTPGRPGDFVLVEFFVPVPA
jgi:hypothetical protein